MDEATLCYLDGIHKLGFWPVAVALLSWPMRIRTLQIATGFLFLVILPTKLEAMANGWLVK